MIIVLIKYIRLPGYAACALAFIMAESTLKVINIFFRIVKVIFAYILQTLFA